MLASVVALYWVYGLRGSRGNTLGSLRVLSGDQVAEVLKEERLF
jgi:hypothetical protein